MVDGKLFDTLAALADRLRKKTDKPFGGIQVCIIQAHAFMKETLTIPIACHYRRLFPTSPSHTGEAGTRLCVRERRLGQMHRTHRYSETSVPTER